MKIPSSLLNMYKELADNIPGFSMPRHGHLEKWAKQGKGSRAAVMTECGGDEDVFGDGDGDGDCNGGRGEMGS